MYNKELNMKIGKVEITNHARARLEQRVVTHEGYRSWEHLAKVARYTGQTRETMGDEEWSYCVHHGIANKLNNSSQVRYLNGFFYIFRGSKGHARKLVTVIKKGSSGEF